MNNNQNEIRLPKKQNTEDTIFNHCVNGIDEFPQYLTSYDNIESKAHTKILSKAYKNLNLDSVFECSDGKLINIEHHSSLTKEKLARDIEYMTTLYSATLRDVEQYIMYTGELPINKTIYLNYRDVYTPNYFITKQMDGEVKLNNLKYKTENNKKIIPFDILDLIWMPTFRIDISKEDLIVELSKLYANMPMPYPSSEVAEKCLILWAGKYVKDLKKIKTVAEELKMSAIHIRPLEEEIRDAVIDGEITRAEERGMKKGKEKGIKEGIKEEREGIVKRMLKQYTPQEISKITGINIKQINKIQKEIGN